MSSINPGRSKLFSDARINWNRIEDLLKDEDVDGDILTILDACYSSNIVTKQTEPVESKRRFQLMSACAINQTTASPGQYSFTRALIDALKDIVDTRGNKAFSTFHLLQRINMDQRRQDSPSVLWTRTGPDQHIRLAPLEDCKVAASLRALSSSLPRGQLTLRFNIRDESLNEEQIEYLATTLSTALHDKAIIGLRGIDWLGISAVPVHHLNRVALAMFVLVQWRKYVKKMRDRRNLKRKRI